MSSAEERAASICDRGVGSICLVLGGCRAKLFIVRGVTFAMTMIGACIMGPLPLRGAEVQPQPIVVVDLHVDLPYQVGYEGKDFTNGSGEYLASSLVQSGVLGTVLPLYVPREVSPEGPRKSDLEESRARVLGLLAKTPPYSPPGCSPEHGSVLTWLAFEGAGPLAQEPESVTSWVERGIRVFGLVHSYDNALATSSGNPDASTGLTAPGRDVVRRIFRHGALVDVSHASDPATDDILDLAAELGGVVVATHSNSRAVSAHPRNITDDQARRIAKTGGVIGVNFHARFLNGGTSAKLSDVVRHVRHFVRVAGIDHVAIGSDFEGGIRPPPELKDIRGFPVLANTLLKAGLSRDEVSKIFHRNALRVLCPARNEKP